MMMMTKVANVTRNLGQEWRTSGTRLNILGTPPIKTFCILIPSNKLKRYIFLVVNK